MQTHLTPHTLPLAPCSPVLHMSTHNTADARAPSASIKDKLLQLLRLVANTGEAGAAARRHRSNVQAQQQRAGTATRMHSGVQAQDADTAAVRTSHF